MNRQLEDFYFNLALETARAESEEWLGEPDCQVVELGGNCVTPTRAEVIARGSSTSEELLHLHQCRVCSHLVQKFASGGEEQTPIHRIIETLKRYGMSTDQLVQDWIRRVQANARIFSHGFGELAFEVQQTPQTLHQFEIDGVVLDLDLREETGQFVVEASSTDETRAGRLLTVVLLGGTGEEERVPIQLNESKGQTCYGSGVVTGIGTDVVKKLGPLIIPIILPEREGPH